MIEFANDFDLLLQVLVIGDPAAHFLNPFAAHAELTRTAARIAHRQDEDTVALTARACRAIFGVSDCALQQSAAQHLAGDWQFVDQFVARADGLLTNHLSKGIKPSNQRQLKIRLTLQISGFPQILPPGPAVGILRQKVAKLGTPLRIHPAGGGAARRPRVATGAGAA